MYTLCSLKASDIFIDMVWDFLPLPYFWLEEALKLSKLLCVGHPTTISAFLLNGLSMHGIFKHQGDFF